MALVDVNKLIALCGATVAVMLAPSAALGAAGTKVTVRIEGVNKTLLAPTAVQTQRGWITKGGTPRGTCPKTSAAGALDVAAHHDWRGSYDPTQGLEITSILGETHTFASLRDFWEIFVNNRAATAGACALKLHRGDQLLFAAVSQKTIAYPIAIRAPRTATVGHRFNVKVVWFNAKGVAKPLSGAGVSVHGRRVRTRTNGIVGITWGSAGTIVIRASRRGYVRAVPARVQRAYPADEHGPRPCAYPADEHGPRPRAYPADEHGPRRPHPGGGCRPRDGPRRVRRRPGRRPGHL